MFPALSFQGIMQARMADLKARLVAAGFPYNVDSLETDPSNYLQEASAYRELLTQQAIQDAQKSVLLAFAQGQSLDRLGDDQGTARLSAPAVYDVAGNLITPAIPELDAKYRGRIQLAPEAFSATGTPGAYIWYAMGADPHIADVGCQVINQGLPSVYVQLTIMSRLGLDGMASRLGVGLRIWVR